MLTSIRRSANDLLGPGGTQVRRSGRTLSHPATVDARSAQEVGLDVPDRPNAGPD